MIRGLALLVAVAFCGGVLAAEPAGAPSTTPEVQARKTAPKKVVKKKPVKKKATKPRPVKKPVARKAAAKRK